MSAKIIKTIRVDIKSCKDYYITERTLCIICRDGKFGIAEKHEGGRLTVIIDCEYDYIDTFCAENGFTNMIAVLRGDKWGLYAFRWTVSSKSDKINCEMIADCEYDTITIQQKRKVAFLMNETGNRYYNLWSGKLSGYCGCSISEDGSMLECVSDGMQRWIDIVTDTVIYARPTSRYVIGEKICNDIYKFDVYYDKDAEWGDPDWHETSDIVYFDRDSKTSYVAFDIRGVKLQTKGFADYIKRYDVHFKKENESFHISDSDYEWDFGKFFEIAEEIEYSR